MYIQLSYLRLIIICLIAFLISCIPGEGPPTVDDEPEDTVIVNVVIDSTNIDGTPSVADEVTGDSVVEVVFPFGEGGTAWKVSWEAVKGHGLVVHDAYFKRDIRSDEWIKIFHDARIIEIAVPYAPGNPRYFDVGFAFDLVRATEADKGPNGELLGNPPVVIKEVNDRGVVWKDDEDVYRGKELVLWGTLDAANYNYVIQYTFKDDGTVSFRVAATASNLPGQELVAHSHTTLWRVDVDLGGPENDKVMLMRHLEPEGSLAARQTMELFNNGVEGWADWNPVEYNMLLIQDTVLKNDQGTPIGYNAMARRPGTPRHYGEREGFTQHDFWVTRAYNTEMIGELLPDYVADEEPIVGEDIAIWYVSPTLHVPRAEDGRFVGDTWEGVALCMWSGFDLKPRNLFSKTPFYTPNPQLEQ